ncbi:uncharacterized protein VTP21DRAFT_7728 [Calcarisporiella thermophila]|uniref:uncharacterized protein n=1 Tax=Calcarisporiella thermophila TaxID=911321 RepID=UPI00374299F3
MSTHPDTILSDVDVDLEGRVLKCVARSPLLPYPITLINIYAPSAEPDTQAFYEAFPASLEAHRLIMGGDFNTHLDPAIDRAPPAPNSQNRKGSSHRLRVITSAASLTDVHRHFSPKGDQFTYSHRRSRMRSRLDLFWVSPSLISKTTDVTLLDPPGTSYDHMAIQIEIRNSVAPKSGYGQWRFNSSLADDELYTATLKAHWHYLLTTRESFRTPGHFWNAVKQEFQSLTTTYAAHSQRRESHDQLEKLRNQLAAHVDRRTEALRIRSRLNWTDQGEKSTAYFHRRIAGRRAVNAMTSLKRADGTRTEDPSEIARMATHFYTELYAGDPTSTTDQNTLLNHVDKTLSTEAREKLEEPISEEEVRRAIRLAPKNKSPGPDGITAEFYRAFEDELAPTIQLLFNEALTMDSPINFSKKATIQQFLCIWRSILFPQCFPEMRQAVKYHDLIFSGCFVCGVASRIAFLGILIGPSSFICTKEGNHGADGQYGVTIVRFSCSNITFRRTRAFIVYGGLAYGLPSFSQFYGT